MFFLVVLLIASMAGFFTGLLGIGGGLITFPAFLFILPSLGLKTLPIHQITGLTAVQIVLASLFSFLSHRKNISLERKDFAYIGISSALGALTGSIVSIHFQEKLLLIIYLLMMTVSFLSLTVIKFNDKEQANPNRLLLSILCFFSGTVSGALGLGGAVLYIPILRYFYGISTKQAISIATFIVFSGALMTIFGKALTSQIPYNLVIFTMIGAFIGAKFGSFLSKKLSSVVLKRILLVVIVVTSIRIFLEVII